MKSAEDDVHLDGNAPPNVHGTSEFPVKVSLPGFGMGGPDSPGKEPEPPADEGKKKAKEAQPRTISLLLERSAS